MIHQFINNDYSIILDVNSGSVHVADPVLYDAVAVLAGIVEDMEEPRLLFAEECRRVEEELGLRYTKEEIAEALEEIQELINRERSEERRVGKEC